MLRLDHFVIHIDNDFEKINKLKKEFDKLNLPFNPQKGKGTKGFKVANFWTGEQYLEMLYLKNLDGGGWKSEWVDKYNQGKRGIFGICLFTDSLDEIKEGLMKKGLEIEGPERITFSMFFGLFKKSLPFRTVYVKPIPNSDLQIFFLQMDSEKKYELTKKFMKPNAQEVGVSSIYEAIVKKKFSNEEWIFIQKIFPQLIEEQGKRTVNMGDTKLHFLSTQDDLLTVDLHLKVEREEHKNRRIEIENVSLYLE